MYSFPTFRYYSSTQDKVKFLTANIEEDITALGQEIQGLKQQITQANQKRVHLDAENQQNVSAERRTETQLMKIRESKRKCVMVTLKIFIYHKNHKMMCYYSFYDVLILT